MDSLDKVACQSAHAPLLIDCYMSCINTVMCRQVRRPDDYDAKKVAELGPWEPSQSLNSLVLSQLKRPPPPPPAPVLPPAPAPALPSPSALGPSPSGEVEDGEVGGAGPAVTRVLKLEHMVSTLPCLAACMKDLLHLLQHCVPMHRLRPMHSCWLDTRFCYTAAAATLHAGFGLCSG